jgi:hypothetical protein
MTEPAAGWYRDPADGSAWRWWDGATWTEHVRASEQAVAAVPAAPAAPPEQAAPVAPPEPAAPAATAGPAQLASIPQPGHTAAAPARTGGPVTSTVDIPITDQLYWHSAEAEVIDVPRLPHHTVSGEIASPVRRAPGFERDWQDLGSPQTAGIWLLAALPLLALPISVALDLVFAIGRLPFANLAAGGVLLGLCWVFGYFDMRSLGARGYHPPSIWWMLLAPPLFYFVARRRSVRRENMRAWPPELLFFPVVLLFVALLLLASLPLLARMIG